MLIRAFLVWFLILALIVSIPTWPHSADWGYTPSTWVAILLMILIILSVTGRL